MPAKHAADDQHLLAILPRGHPAPLQSSVRTAAILGGRLTPDAGIGNARRLRALITAWYFPKSEGNRARYTGPARLSAGRVAAETGHDPLDGA